ncbi:hypothetical protein B7463_g5561, partial [Scytalidium lignicola]
NSKAWIDRIAIAEKQNQVLSGEAVVGTELAEITARRWFVNYEVGGKVTEEAKRITEMVERNSLQGFKDSVKALWEYDMKPLLSGASVRGAFLVGGGDGVLPASMKVTAASYGKSGGEYAVIDGAGHLPMVEKPKEFTAAVEKFLG